MKNLQLALVFILTVAFSYAQNFQGKAMYMSKTKFNFDFGERKIPEDAKQRMKKRMDAALQKTFVLNFTKTASIYEEEVQLESAGGPGGGKGGRGAMFASMFGGPAAGKSYKNLADKEYKRAVEFFGKNFLIQEPLQAFPWKLEKESKKIGKYTCFKATTMIGKNKSSSTKEVDTVQTQELVTVWYTPEIPVSLGPDKYWGLPGLILSVYTAETQIVCTQVILNVKEKVEIKAPKTGKKISEEKFQKIVDSKTAELKERFKKGSGGGGPGGKKRQR